ncbi:MAG TPA: DEAD/DEAH box helicase [Gammaproteobacteria bacterium]|nr:DEAD/DEAH box helicase [Gammaproteobacteria bacterium]
MDQPLHLIYIITFQSQPTLRYFVEPGLVNVLRSGGYSKPRLVSTLEEIPTEIVRDNDRAIFKLLEKLPEKLLLDGNPASVLLQHLLRTGRCHFASHRSKPITEGPILDGNVQWIKEPDGKQRLHCWVSGRALSVIPLKPLWYVEHEKSCCGILRVPLDPEAASYLLKSPPLSEAELKEIYVLLKQTKSETEAKKQLKEHLQKITAPYSEKEIDYWYCDWKATSSQRHWFEFEMGISLEGEKVNLLPILSEFIQSQLSLHSLAELNSMPDDKIFVIKLKNEKTIAFPMKRLRKILAILTELYEEDSLSGNDKLRLSQFRALQFNDLQDVLGTKNIQWRGELSPHQLADKFASYLKQSKLNLPKNFQGELREYQQEGVRWLQFLKEMGFGGVLADDMGLGKTVQLLAHLLIEKTKNHSVLPTLIVAPTSLLMNWKREAERFTPSLKVLILHGNLRRDNFAHLNNYDVIITTYALLIRDEEMLVQQKFHLLVLDEAQYIKNIHSKAGQIARKLNAEQRLCLTGTPMENHLGELWSLFHFLLPGLLGEKSQFYKLFRTPIEKNGDGKRRDYLRQRISPFFLRRTKKEVLKELPEKIEMIQPVVLTDAQRELYEDIRIALHDDVLSVIKERGFGRSQIYILDALLKLRQVCCDPRLLKWNRENTNFDVLDSAKLQWLMDLLPNLIDQGRKILLFSQFTEMIALIESACKSAHIPYVKLTGKTEDRDAVIQQFQSGEIPLFLISLKAGGVGLNLTQADTVIHYDPWWNPAVENQATDRAHRIGQDKTVFVYKLITSGTIEEKILALQNEKQALLTAMLSGSIQSIDELSLTDVETLFAPLPTNV